MAWPLVPPSQLTTQVGDQWEITGHAPEVEMYRTKGPGLSVLQTQSLGRLFSCHYFYFSFYLHSSSDFNGIHCFILVLVANPSTPDHSKRCPVRLSHFLIEFKLPYICFLNDI